MLPNYYLQIIIIPINCSKLRKSATSRAEEVAIEVNLMKQFQEKDRVDLPDDMMKRGGALFDSRNTIVECTLQRPSPKPGIERAAQWRGYGLEQRLGP